MNIRSEITDDYNGKVTVEIPQEESAPLFAKALKDFQTKASLDGFRPGKTPMGYIRTRFAKALFENKAEELAKERLDEIMKQVELKPGGQMTLNLLEYGDSQPLRFELLFPLRPEPNLSVYKGLRITVNEVQVTDKDVEHQIESYRYKYAVMQSLDTPAPAEARIFARVQEVDHSGCSLIGRPVEEMKLEMGLDVLGIGGDEQLLGIRAGEKRIIQVSNPNLLHQLSSRHIISASEASEQDYLPDEIYYQVEALRVEKPVLPELDDDFAVKAKEHCKTMAELRDWIKADLTSLAADYFNRQMQTAVKRALIDENPFRLSNMYLDDILNQAASKSKKETENIRQNRDNYTKEIEFDLKWDLLCSLIRKTENFTVSDQEIEEQIKRIAEQTHKPLDEIQAYYKKENKRQKLHDQMIEIMTVGFLVKHAIVDRREISFDDFLQLLKKQFDVVEDKEIDDSEEEPPGLE